MFLVNNCYFSSSGREVHVRTPETNGAKGQIILFIYGSPLLFDDLIFKGIQANNRQIWLA